MEHLNRLKKKTKPISPYILNFDINIMLNRIQEETRRIFIHIKIVLITESFLGRKEPSILVHAQHLSIIYRTISRTALTFSGIMDTYTDRTKTSTLEVLTSFVVSCATQYIYWWRKAAYPKLYYNYKILYKNFCLSDVQLR